MANSNKNFECAIGAHSFTWRVIQAGACEYRVIGVCVTCKKEVKAPGDRPTTFSAAYTQANSLNHKNEEA